MARPQLVSDEEALAAAKIVFLTHGARASMDAVAASVGISAPALSKRFGSKKDLMVAALAPPTPGWFWRLRAGPTDAPIRTQLRLLATEMDAFFSEMIPCMMVLKEAGLSEDAMISHATTAVAKANIKLPDNTPFPIVARNLLADFLTKTAADGQLVVEEPVVAAQIFLGGIQSRHFMRRINGETGKPEDGPSYVNALVDIIIHGLQPRSENEEEA